MAVAAGLVAFSLYLATLAPSITWRFDGADSGDFAAAVATWGIPHPTGYPLYIVLAGAFAHVTAFSELAYRLNLFSAVCSSAATALVVLTVARVARHLDGGPEHLRLVTAFSAGLAHGTSRTVWSHSVLTEVYALELLFAALIGLLLVEMPLPRGRLTLLAAVCGLSLTHHETIVFSIAGAASAIAIARPAGPRLHGRTLVAAASAFVAPLTLYLLLPWRAAQHPASNWGDPTTLGRFFADVTAAPYHGYLDWNPLDALRALPAVARFALGQFAWWMLPLAVLGISKLWSEFRAYAVFLLVLAALPQLFVAAYRAQGREVYAVQSTVALCIAAGVGGVAGLGWLCRFWSRIPARGLFVVALGAGLLTVVPSAFVGLREFNLTSDRAAYNYAVGTLLAAPPGGTLYAETDEQTFPLWYAQRALHVRPDVHIIAVRFRDPAHQR